MESVSRRKFLQVAAAGAFGASGLSKLVREVHGKEPDGKPLVLKHDLSGNPAEVRYVSPKRYNRIKQFERMGPDQITASNNKITGLGLEKPGTPDVLPRIKVFINRMTSSFKSQAPQEVNGAPVVYEVDEPSAEFFACSRKDKSFNTLEGNIRVGNFAGTGTLSFVAKNGNGNDTAVTAAHVVTTDTGFVVEELFHPEDGDRNIGDYGDSSPASSSGYDLAHYPVSDGETTDIAGTKESDQEDIKGTWSYSGLSDTLAQGYEPDVTVAGSQTCTSDTQVINVKKSSILKHEVRYSNNGKMGPGDSGSPIVDNNGYLTGTLSGADDNGNGALFGPAAEEAMNELGLSF